MFYRLYKHLFDAYYQYAHTNT